MRGVVVDRDTGEAIAHAWVFAAIPARDRIADVPRVAGARVARSDSSGRFHFDVTTSRGWLGADPPPRFHFYHPSYGLIRGREAGEGPLRLSASLRDAHLRQSDASAYCVARSESLRDPIGAVLVPRVCPPARPDLFADGNPRAEGELDERDRRTGTWLFRREDGSLIAEGEYASGAAVGTWTFHPPASR